MEHDEAFVDQIWWSDEACFKLNGQINRHNCVYWSSENPRVLVEKAVNLPGITVWAAISSLGIIGPYFFEGTVTADAYLTMLQTFFWPRAQNHQDFYFQQDGAPPHYGLKVREWLDTNFEGKWIGRRGPIEWPARSPDLTPPDFFLWGVIKSLLLSKILEAPLCSRSTRSMWNCVKKFAEVSQKDFKSVLNIMENTLNILINL